MCVLEDILFLVLKIITVTGLLVLAGLIIIIHLFNGFAEFIKNQED